MMTSICKEYYQFILAQGALGGLSSGFLFTPATSVISHYFMKKRGAALGLAVVGSSIGGVVFPLLLKNAFASKTLGFGWGVRIAGLGNLFFLTIACILIKERLPARRGPFFVLGAFLQPSYSLLIAGIFFLFWGLFVPFFFVASYAIVKVRMSSNMAFYLLAILNGTSVFGRTICGASADKLGWFNMLTFIGFSNVVLLFCWNSATTNAGLIVWTGFFGFFSGAVMSLFPACLASCAPKPQLIGTYIGQAIAVLALAGLTGTPIAGAIVARHGYSGAGYFAAVSMLVGSILIGTARLTRERKLLALA